MTCDDKCKAAQRPACRTCLGNGGPPHAATTVHPTMWHHLEFGQVEALSEACSLPGPPTDRTVVSAVGGPRVDVRLTLLRCEADVDVRLMLLRCELL